MNREVDDDRVALAIELGQMCETFQCLPGAGGLLDQDPYLLKLVRSYHRVVAQVQEQQTKSAIPRH